MKPLAPFREREAVTEANEARKWKCESCDLMIENERAQYCAACSQYWTDVENGMFDTEDYE